MSRWLLSALILSATIVALYDFPIYNRPELWTGAGRLFDSIYNLALSYIMSYIFFLIVWIPDRKNKLRMKQNYIYYVKEIVRIGDQMREALEQTVPTGDPATTLRLIKGNMTCPISFGWSKEELPQSTDWTTFLGIQSGRIHSAYKNLGAYMLFADTELISKVSAVAECNFCKMCTNNLISHFIGAGSLEVLADPSREYFHLVDDLKGYIRM